MKILLTDAFGISYLRNIWNEVNLIIPIIYSTQYLNDQITFIFYMKSCKISSS